MEACSEVIIFSDNFKILGKICHFPDMRLTDYMNDSHAFLAVTDASVTHLKIDLEFKAAFMDVQRSKIEMIIPAGDYQSK